MPKINQEEYEVLKSRRGINHEWIVRNSMDWLVTSEKKPYKSTWSLKWLSSSGVEPFTDNIDSLFQFIQWEDEEPYNIAELIEEYDTYIAASRTKVLSDTLWDQIKEEETEVKDIEWAKSELNSERKKLSRLFEIDKGSDQERYFNDGKDKGVEFALSVLNQLDEPETLSQEWIIDNQERKDIHFYVRVNRLQNLLVPKQEKVKISQYVADFIEYQKGTMSLYDVVAQAVHMNWSDDRINGFIRKYLEIFVRAWRHGYEIEEEPKYYILLPDMKTNWRYVSLRKSYDGLTTHYTDTTDDIYAFTEKEIKGFEKGDVWFDHFAKPVEEVEE